MWPNPMNQLCGSLVPLRPHSKNIETFFRNIRPYLVSGMPGAIATFISVLCVLGISDQVNGFEAVLRRSISADEESWERLMYAWGGFVALRISAGLVPFMLLISSLG
jgi:hypothetical protein